MACKSEAAFGTSVLLGDFSAQNVYGCKDVICYDVNGNRSRTSGIDEGGNASVRGIWYQMAGMQPSVGDVKNCLRHSGAIPAGSLSLAALSQRLPLSATSSSDSGSAGLSWLSTSSDMGRVWSTVTAPPHETFSSNLPSLATVHWPPGVGTASVPISDVPTTHGFGRHPAQALSGCLDLQRQFAQSRSMTNGCSVVPTVVIPIPCRRLTAGDLSLLQNQPISKDEPAENIDPEDFIRRLRTPASERCSSESESRPSSADLSLVSGQLASLAHQSDGSRAETSQKRPSYLEMVARALMSSPPDFCLPLAKIYGHVQDHNPHLSSVAIKSWKNSVRHTLSSQPCFAKAQSAMPSLHMWRLHRAFLVDFRADKFHSGLVKKRAKELRNKEQVVKLLDSR
ncbi:hypothetical protein LSH36_184g00005 [Paralvinella palmiformis]|uniref:Fork-head domain-containing protein n=1 Tax=Paralvinella palmiformis TaxID=53620 RepID=A0AAD9N7E7_9ANNE|nr:hypothetical protein LSH36_184g00005 [Paralvinella palmiformis]